MSSTFALQRVRLVHDHDRVVLLRPRLDFAIMRKLVLLGALLVGLTACSSNSAESEFLEAVPKTPLSDEQMVGVGYSACRAVKAIEHRSDPRMAFHMVASGIQRTLYTDIVTLDGPQVVSAAVKHLCPDQAWILAS